MARQYELTPMRRLVNRIMKWMLRLGIAPKGTYLLTVRGHKSSKLYSTPVTLMENGAERWLVAPYGEVSWVRNARAAGEVTLSRGGSSETVAIRELSPQESAPVLKQYVTEVPITRPYFDAEPDASLEAFVAEAPKHPVFRIEASRAAA